MVRQSLEMPALQSSHPLRGFCLPCEYGLGYTIHDNNWVASTSKIPLQWDERTHSQLRHHVLIFLAVSVRRLIKFLYCLDYGDSRIRCETENPRPNGNLRNNSILAPLLCFRAMTRMRNTISRKWGKTRTINYLEIILTYGALMKYGSPRCVGMQKKRHVPAITPLRCLRLFFLFGVYAR